MSTENAQPDYAYWCKYDIWTFKQAALLLQDLDPFKYPKISFNSEAPTEAPELYEAHKIYLLLKKCVDFKYNNGAHPIDIFRVAEKKEFSVPKKLKAEILKRLDKEMQPKKSQISNALNPINDKELGTRERNVFLKAVALMSYIFAGRSERYQVADHPNAFQISQAILETAETMSVDTTGLKSFHRKIKEALKFLEHEQDKESEL